MRTLLQVPELGPADGASIIRRFLFGKFEWSEEWWATATALACLEDPSRRLVDMMIGLEAQKLVTQLILMSVDEEAIHPQEISKMLLGATKAVHLAYQTQSKGLYAFGYLKQLAERSHRDSPCKGVIPAALFLSQQLPWEGRPRLAAGEKWCPVRQEMAELDILSWMTKAVLSAVKGAGA